MHWLLVEWIDNDNLSPSFDIVNIKYLDGNKKDVCAGKLSILREKYSNNTRPAKVLYISDDKDSLKNMKSILVKMNEQMRNTMDMLNNTISQIKTEIMGNCQRINTNRITSAPEASNGNFDVNSSSTNKNIVKSTHNKSTQTARQYSAKYIRKLENSLRNGLEEITREVISLEDDYDYSIISEDTLKENTNIESTNDSFTGNFEPLKKRSRAKNEVIGANNMTKNMNPDCTGTPKTSTPLVRQYVNRKILTPIVNVIDMEPENNNTIQNGNPDESDSTALKIYENTNITHHDNHNTYSYSDHENNSAMVKKEIVEDKVPIGKGSTLIPKRIYENLNWSSYTNATRKLLEAVFSREVLSTHSLSGKQSPAFSNKPAKKQLDPIIVNDIIATVSEKCDINRKFVRTCITIKCADEAKMLKQRMNRSNKEESFTYTKEF